MHKNSFDAWLLLVMSLGAGASCSKSPSGKPNEPNSAAHRSDPSKNVKQLADRAEKALPRLAQIKKAALPTPESPILVTWRGISGESEGLESIIVTFTNSSGSDHRSLAISSLIDTSTLFEDKSELTQCTILREMAAVVCEIADNSETPNAIAEKLAASIRRARVDASGARKEFFDPEPVKIGMLEWKFWSSTLQDKFANEKNGRKWQIGKYGLSISTLVD